MANIIALDLGTTTTTGILLDLAEREVQHLFQRSNAGALQTESPTRAEQNPHRLRDLALDILSELATAEVGVDGIALTGQVHGLLCVDGDGEPLTPLISWQDQRTTEVQADGSTTLAHLHRRVADLPWQVNGCQIAPGYGAATLFWLVRQGELPRGTRRVCTLPDWLAGQLTGNAPVSDPTLAASWGLYDLVADDWNTAFLERLDLPAWLLPSILGSGDELGGLVSHVARQVGLPGGIPVLNPIGDTQAAFLGSVAEPETTVLFNLGTGGQICWMVSQFEAPSERVETRPLLGRHHLRVGASLCGGAAYAWLNRTVRSWLSEFGVERDEQTVYARLNAMASACERPEPLRVRPTFLGVRGDPGVQWGAIEGIALDGIELGALARATLIGIVDELRDLYAAHASRMEKHRQVVGTGGGVQNNRLLPALIEERFGLAVHVPCHRETAAVGAALLPRFIRDASE